MPQAQGSPSLTSTIPLHRGYSQVMQGSREGPQTTWAGCVAKLTSPLALACGGRRLNIGNLKEEMTVT